MYQEAEFTRLRQGLYRLLAALFLYPDRERLARLQNVALALQQVDDLWGGNPFAGPLERLLGVVSTLDQETAVAIENEYVRLFQVRPAAPPYQSFYLDPDGLVRGWIAVQLECEYATAGLTLSPALRELPDHVAVELEFLAYLCGQEAKAQEIGAWEKSVRARERQRAFLAGHLGRWLPLFVRKAQEANPATLYGPTIESTSAFIRHDLQLLCH